MVGKRQHFSSIDEWNRYSKTSHSQSVDGETSNGKPQNGDVEHGRLEPQRNQSNGSKHQSNGSRQKPAMMRFKDAARTALEDRRREELKEALLSNIDREGLEKHRKSKEELKAIKNKKVRKFYEEQNDRLNDWLEVDAVVMAVADDVLESMDPDPDNDGDDDRHGGIQHVEGHVTELLPEDEKEARKKGEQRAKIAINVNVVANIFLVIAKLIASFSSSSLSLIASLVDSALDLLCTIIIWTTNRLIGWRLSALQRKFPVGRRRLEPMGILVFSIIMVFSFLQVLQESVEKLIPLKGKAEMLPPIAIAALAATIGIKGLIWIGCAPIKTNSVQALGQDCRTDVVFNSLSLLFPVIGYYTGAWWLDPLGAALLSLFIIYDWAETSFENMTKLSGEAAETRMLKKLINLGYRFAPVIEGLKNVTAYHAGDGIWVEYDLLMRGDTPLSKSHDISETLQYCAEGLTDVDRCFVTIDYSIKGPTGHNTD